MKGLVYVIDDDASVLRSVSRLIRGSGYPVGTFESAEAFLERFPRGFDHPACAVVDLHLPGLGGLELQERLAALPIPCPVVFVSGNGDIASSVRAMRKGAVTFLTKPFDEGDLLRAIEEGLAAHLGMIREAGQAASARERIQSLSDRERETLAWVITGALNKQIAGQMGITERTVKAHRAQVMDKMGVRSVAELVRRCDAAGFHGAD